MPKVAGRPLFVVAVLFAALLTAFATRYGYHRDELYFLAAGRHPAWSYPDQPPMTPLLARAMSAIDADSLLLLRLPSISAATFVVVAAGLMARELGGGRGAQVLASVAVASAAMVLGIGHLLSTASFDMAAWVLVCLLVLGLLRGAQGWGVDRNGRRPEVDESSVGRGPAASDEGVDGRVGPDGRAGVGGWGPRWWLAVGLVVGVGLQNKVLLIFPVAALVLALALVGPRKIFATKYFPIAVGSAVLIWLPYLLWQWRNGWPQWDMSRAIAGGSSGTSDSSLTFVLSQFGLMGPLLVPLWALGLWRLWRDPRRRAFPVAYAVLFVVFLVSGGKAYYLGGMYPILSAAGAVPVAARLGNRRARRAAVGSVIAVNATVSALLFLPVLPIAVLKDSPVLAINYDAGETIGWPQFVRRIAEVRAMLGPDVAILTDNYGEAGAIERFGGEYGLPTPHSGHNSYWWWGPPSDTASAVIVVGLDRDRLTGYFAEVEPAGQVDNGLGIDNDEQGQPLFICRKPRAPLSEIWPAAKHLS
ncbi:glycosyltransferase family 39 protein [Nocardia sp. CA-120079]|uniref:glycosyltransferase family 39 protein n=1 Tax=Nocardia sp. CA-120079 TaxID=3239974 RepID=UPI003D98EB8D